VVRHCLSLLPVLWRPEGTRSSGFRRSFIGGDYEWSPCSMKRSGKRAPFTVGRREVRIQHLSQLRMTYEGRSCEIPIRAPDISPHGMFVNVSTHFPEGAIVLLRFRLTRSNVEVQTRAEVRYCLPGIGIGVEFVGMELGALRAIEKELRTYRPLRRTRKK